MESTIKGNCIACGKPLEIPGELEEFCCMYCGQRMVPTDLMPAPAAAAWDRDWDRDALAEELLGAIIPYPDTVKYLLPDKYSPYYETWLERHRTTAEKPGTVPPEGYAALSEAFLERLDRWSEEKGRLFSTKNSRLEDAKFTLCLVTIPAIQAVCGEAGTAFCRVLHEKWMTRFPEHIFQVTTYEEICQGFHKRKLCFITTAVCAYQGKDDDCAELTAFRRFRDGYLATAPGGDALIEEYYRVAPGIVTAISLFGQPDKVYPALWETCLEPCYRSILAGDNERCKERYTQMVRTLAAQYLKQ